MDGHAADSPCREKGSADRKGQGKGAYGAENFSLFEGKISIPLGAPPRLVELGKQGREAVVGAVHAENVVDKIHIIVLIGAAGKGMFEKPFLNRDHMFYFLE